MARKSSIKRLPKAVREAVDKAIRDGGMTIAQIVELIESHGEQASHSAVGRYKLNADKQMQRYSDMKEISKTWVGHIQEDPDSDVGRLLSEMLKTVAFQTLGQFEESEESANAQELMFIGKAIQSIASADKTAAERALKIRREFAKEAAEVIEQEALAAGMGKDQAKFWRQKVLGIV